MGCILPTMHCRSQHCWELLHPFAHHCQHARNNSQHCWRNNVGSCCARLHAASRGGREPKTTTLFFFSQTSIQSSRIQLQKNLPTLDKLNTMEYERKVWSCANLLFNWRLRSRRWCSVLLSSLICFSVPNKGNQILQMCQCAAGAACASKWFLLNCCGN